MTGLEAIFKWERCFFLLFLHMQFNQPRFVDNLMGNWAWNQKKNLIKITKWELSDCWRDFDFKPISSHRASVSHPLGSRKKRSKENKHLDDPHHDARDANSPRPLKITCGPFESELRGSSAPFLFLSLSTCSQRRKMRLE